MSDFNEQVELGRSGLKVGRVGFGSSYGAPATAYEQAFERGCNYFYWGSRRREMMATAIRNIAETRRDDLAVVIQSYSRFGWMMKRSLRGALKKLGLDAADVLLLGWYNQPPPKRVVDAALELKERGEIRHVAISGHQRTMFPDLIDELCYDIWHVRYNAVHRGAEREVFPCIEGLAETQRPGLVTYTTTRWGHLCDPKRTPEGEKTPTGTDCYRFALSASEVDIALAGPSNQEQMDQALRALELGPMSEDELAWMRRVGDHVYGGDATSGVRDSV